MTNREALLLSILSSPADPVPREILADLLEEEGSAWAFRLRLPGYWQLTPDEPAHALLLYWDRPSEQLPPVCTAVARFPFHAVVEACLCPCGAWPVISAYGGWRCLRCSSKAATKTGKGLWEKVAHDEQGDETAGRDGT